MNPWEIPYDAPEISKQKMPWEVDYAAAQEQNPSLLNKLSTTASQFTKGQEARGRKLYNIINTTSTAPLQGQQTPGEAALQLAGHIVGTGTDVAATGLKGLAQTGYAALPEAGQQRISSDIEKLNQAISPYTKQYQQNLEAFNAAYPRAGRNLEAIRELGVVVPVLGGKSIAGMTADLGTSAKGLKSGIGEVGKLTKEAILPAPASSTERKLYSGALYDEARAKGGNFDPEIVNNLEAKIKKSIPSDWNLDTSPSVFINMQEKIASLKGRPVTLDAIEEMDKSLTGLITAEYKAKKGATSDAVRLQELQGELRDMAYNPERKMLIGSDEGVKTLQNATKEWSLAKRTEDLENIIERARYTDNPATSIKRQIATKVTDKRWTRGLSKEQISFLEKVAEDDKLAEFLRTTAGSRLIGAMIGGIGGAAAGGGIGAIPGVIAGAVGGNVARGAAEGIKKSQLRKFEKTIEKQSTLKGIPKEVFKLPPEEAKIIIRKYLEQNQ